MPPFLFWLCCEVCGIISQPGIKPTTSAVEALECHPLDHQGSPFPLLLRKARRGHGVERRPPETSFPKGPHSPKRAKPPSQCKTTVCHVGVGTPNPW